MAYVLKRDEYDDGTVTPEMRRRLRDEPELNMPLDAHLGTREDELTGTRWLAEQAASARAVRHVRPSTIALTAVVLVLVLFGVFALAMRAPVARQERQEAPPAAAAAAKE